MKPATFLAFLAGVGFVTPRPTRTGHALDPGWALLKRGAHLIWNPADPYPRYPGKQSLWEEKCNEALTKAGCRVGIIHKGETKATRNGKETTYIKAEGAPSMDMMANGKKMRVFLDGSAELVQGDWSAQEQASMRRVSLPRVSRRKKPRPQAKRKTVLVWSRDDAYQFLPKKRLQWEKTCDEALTRRGCRAGFIHEGQAMSIHNGERRPYLMVEGAPSLDMMKDPATMRALVDGSKMMEGGRKMRVFTDGSIEDVDEWSARDRRAMAQKKEKKGAQYRPKPQRNQTALIFWSPSDAYQHHQNRKLQWEHLCDQAFTRAGCDGGVMHQGEIKIFKPDGTKTSYINVEAAPSGKPGMENGKQMRVFLDGSVEDVASWSAKDREAIKDGKRRRPLNRHKKASTSTQEPSREPSQDDAQGRSKRPRVGAGKYQS